MATTIPTSQQGSNWETIEAAWVDENAFNLGINDTGNALAWGCAESGRLGNGDPNTDMMSPDTLSLGQQTMAGLGPVTAQVGCDQLFDALMLYQSGAKQDDDVTLVAIHALS